MSNNILNANLEANIKNTALIQTSYLKGNENKIFNGIIFYKFNYLK